MYAKIFTQIFDSSIAEDHEVRHVFEDFLKLADRDGVVDMTVEAVARRTNVPIEKIRRGLSVLTAPDEGGRTPDHNGRRMIPIAEGRAWGWVIVNYQHYRDLQDDEARRAYNRVAKAREREREKLNSPLEKKKIKKPKSTPLPGEPAYVKGVENGTINEDGEAITPPAEARDNPEAV